MIDTEGTGRINKEQLKKKIGNDVFFDQKPDSYWDNLIKEVNNNGSEYVYNKQFKNNNY